MTTCGSPTARIAAASTSPTTSASTMRPGFSVWAARTRPHTADPARSVTSSPANAIAPCVTTSSTPDDSANQACSRARTSWVAPCTRATRSVESVATGTDSNNSTSSAGECAAPAGVAGDHSTSKISPPLSTRPAPANCSAVIGRAVIDPTDSTGSPSPSASSIDTEFTPVGAMRTRTADAPAACSDTRCQENGNASCRSSAASASACSDASSSAGCTPNSPACRSCGNATSANTSSPRRHIAVKPRNAGPYS